MLRQTLIALRLTLLTLLITGFVYPLAVTAMAGLAFPGAAEGSLVTDASGRVVGSELIGQRFSNPAYFHPRPSAAGNDGYDPLASSGSNLGPTSAKLRDRAKADVAKLALENPGTTSGVPADLVTASASGLDPHVSPEGAAWQIARVSAARNVAPERVRQIVDEMTEGRTLGLFGAPRVNVLTLNLALDRRFGAPGTK